MKRNQYNLPFGPIDLAGVQGWIHSNTLYNINKQKCAQKTWSICASKHNKASVGLQEKLENIKHILKCENIVILQKNRTEWSSFC